MGSNTEKKPWTNLLNLYKNWSKEIKSDNFAIAKLDKWRIWTYPISPFNINNKQIYKDRRIDTVGENNIESSSCFNIAVATLAFSFCSLYSYLSFNFAIAKVIALDLFAYFLN